MAYQREPSSEPATEPYTDVLGLRVSAINLPGAVETIEGWIDEGARQYVCICTVHGVMEGRRDPALQTALNRAGLRTPDGMPLVWLSRRAGHRDVGRVYGPDLMLELCARSAQMGHRHYFYGGMPGVADELASRLSTRFPGVRVAGVGTPPMLATGERDTDESIRRINASGADVVWVGMSTPKQDWWVANHREALDAPVLIAVGAAFDFHSGRVRQAPVWMQRRGLEWLFRLAQDPRRLWKRYVVYNSGFVIELIRERLRRRLARTEGKPISSIG